MTINAALIFFQAVKKQIILNNTLFV